MNATECKCCECGKQAVAFWPCIDPDIPSHPYCHKCLDKAKQELMIKLFGTKKKNNDDDRKNKSKSKSNRQDS